MGRVQPVRVFSDAAISHALLDAYRRGFFPMADDPDGPWGGQLLWLSPEPRGIMPLSEAEGFHIPRRLKDRLRRCPFSITTDTCFEEVILACAEPRAYEPKSWIDDRIVEMYTALHRQGHAHSIEVWLGPGERTGGERGLVGGLYGVRIGAAFFAESKFSRPAIGGTDASKVALVRTVEHLRTLGFDLMDVQFWNEHLDQFGCLEIPRAEYLRRLAGAVARTVAWRPLSLAATA
jgi:leucyl/phenylalanyl-tRNA--protein transferase